MYVHTDVLEKLAASIFRVQEIHLVVGGGGVGFFSCTLAPPDR